MTNNIIEYVYKKILEAEAINYPIIIGATTCHHHLTLRAGCMQWLGYPDFYWEECSIKGCCYREYCITLDAYSNCTSILQGGTNYYNWPPGFTCTFPCEQKCGLLAGANILATRPRITIGEFENDKVNLTKDVVAIPNPVTDFITVKFTDDEKGNLSINIVNLLGKTERSYNFIKKDKNFESEINLTGLISGKYFIKIELNNKLYYTLNFYIMN